MPSFSLAHCVEYMAWVLSVAVRKLVLVSCLRKSSQKHFTEVLPISWTRTLPVLAITHWWRLTVNSRLLYFTGPTLLRFCKGATWGWKWVARACNSLVYALTVLVYMIKLDDWYQFRHCVCAGIHFMHNEFLIAMREPECQWMVWILWDCWRRHR